MEELHQDSDQVLENGTGTPYLAIFDINGDPILDPIDGTPIGVYMSSFVYNYEDTKEDDGEFELETNHPDIVSLSQLQYKMSIMLQWGYIYPSGKSLCGPARTVMVIGNKSVFGPSGVKITIKFADSSILLKTTMPSSYDQTVDTVDHIIENLKNAGTYVQVRKFGKVETGVKVYGAQRVVRNEDIKK